MIQSHVRIPPDSTGKRAVTKNYVEISYSNLIGDIQIDDTVGIGSNKIGSISYIKEESSTTGKVLVNLYPDVLDSVLINGATLTLDGNPPTGTFTVVDFIPYHISKSILVGNNNPSNALSIDNRGAAFTRFAEGAPLFDAFGGQKVSEPNTIGVYEFSSDGGDGLFSIIKTGSATDEYDQATSCVVLSCGTSATDSVIRSSNKYHYYWPGNGTTILMSAGLSDNGIINNTRRLGFFDEKDGLFFEMKDNIAYVVLRSSVSGVVNEIRVPQTEWNFDKFDGNGISRVTSDWSKATVYWIDLQWLGAGRVRFGILGPDGSRLVAHEFRNSGANAYPYMKRASLPVRAENFNTGLTGNSTQLRMTCLVVKCDGLVDYTYYRQSAHHSSKIVSNNTPLISLRAAPLYEGYHNPVNIYAEEYNCFVEGGNVRLDFCWPITLTGATYSGDFGAALIDTDATAATIDDDYWLYASYYLAPGPNKIDLRSLFEKNDEGIIMNVDGTFCPWNVVATSLSGTPSITGTLTWKELR